MISAALVLLGGPAMASHDHPRAVGVQAYVAEVSGGVPPGDSVAIREVTATLDVYPTMVVADATWAVAGEPGSYLLALYEGFEYEDLYVPLHDLVVTVAGAPAVEERRVWELPFEPVHPVFEESIRALVVPVEVPESATVPIRTRFRQLTPWTWRLGDDPRGIVWLSWSRGARGSGTTLDRLDVLVRYHGVRPSQLVPHEPTETWADGARWRAEPATAAGVSLTLEGALDPVLSRRQAVAPYMRSADRALQLEEWLIRFADDTAPHTPGEWAILIDALHASADDPEIGRASTWALQDLQTWVRRVDDLDERAREVALGWLDPAVRIEGSGVLAADDVGFAADAFPALLSAAQLRAERRALDRALVAPALVGIAMGLSLAWRAAHAQRVPATRDPARA
jgi:hypothetical protein